MRRFWFGLTFVFILAFATFGMTQVSIVSPREGEMVRSRWLNLKVEKPTQEGYVMIWLNGKFLTAVTAPFEFRIDLTEQKILSGTHTLRVAGFNKLGQKEGETQVQFQVQLIGEEVENLRLVFKPRTGELAFYTFQASSETNVDIPARAIRQKVPQLSTKLTLRWFQTVRDITVDRHFRMMRVVEDGMLEREAPPTTFGAPMTGGAPMMGGAPMTGGAPMMGGAPMIGGAPMMGGMPGAGPMGRFGGIPGEEAGLGMLGPAVGAPGAPTMPGVFGFAISPLRLRLRPIDSQKVALFTLLPNGDITMSEEMPNVVKFVTGSLDIKLPEDVLKVGSRWMGFITLPRNLENLTIIGAAMTGMPGMGGAPMMGGMPSEEFPGSPMMGGMIPGGPMMGRPGMPGSPLMPGSPTPPMAPGMMGPVQEPEALIADAPFVNVPASHRLDGFEYWNDKLCARIVSEFRNVSVELDLMPTTGMGQTGLGAMFGPPGTPGMTGGQMAPVGPMPGGPMGPSGPGAIGMPGVPGPGGQLQQPPQTRLKGTAEGTRTLLFDIENGQVVYVKVTMKANFDTDFATVMPFVQIQQQFAGVPGAAPGTTGGQMMPGFGVPGGEVGGGIGGAPFLGTPWGGGFYTGAPFGGSPFGGGIFGGTPFGGIGGAPFGGGTFGGTPFGGAPFGGMAFGSGAPTFPNPFGRFGMGTFGPTGPTAPGGLGMPSPGLGAPGMPQQQLTFRNYPAKLSYSLNLENILTHLGRLDQQLRSLLGAR